MHHKIVRKRDDLPTLFALENFKIGVEVGVCKGKYSVIICQKMPGVKLYCIDPWTRTSDNRLSPSNESHERFFKMAQEALAAHDVTFLREFSMTAVHQFGDESLDFVYIDGNHAFDFVIQDIIEWSKKVRRGGIVAGHDYYDFPSGKGGIVPAVDAYVDAHHIQQVYFTKDKTPSWFWYKK